MTEQERALNLWRELRDRKPGTDGVLIIAAEFRAALRERDAVWAKAVNDALGICIWPYHEVCDRCRPLRALLEEAGK